MKVFHAAPLALLLVLSACSGSSESSSGDDQTSQSPSDSASQNADGSNVSESDVSSEAADGSSDNEDAAEITGNPDLDLEELEEVAPEVADALDDIDDIVSIGDCSSETVGLAMTYVPQGWECRVLDQPVAGMDGFTLFKPENNGGIEITIGTPTPVGLPCVALQLCETAESIDLGSTFEMEVINMGVDIIYGTHKTVDAEASVVSFTALSEADVEFVTMVLDGVQVL